MNGYPPWLTSLAVNSLVKSGRWQNDILIITSHPPASFQLDSSALFSVKFAHRESMATTLGVKRMKCSLLSAPAFPELSPYGQILYLDSDIIAVREVPDVWSDMFSRGTPIALYPDAGAHIIGWCSGCDKFHSGVIAVQRGKEAEQVFETWCRHLGEGDGGGVQGGITDQVRRILEWLSFALSSL